MSRVSLAKTDSLADGPGKYWTPAGTIIALPKVKDKLVQARGEGPTSPHHLREARRPRVNQVLSREEVAALLQGMAEAESNHLKPGKAKKSRAPERSYKTKANRKVHRRYLAGPPR